MFCSSCNRAIFSRRSTLCIPCSAAYTLQEEFKEEWGDSKLRVLAGDIAVSAARHIRGLRVASTSAKGATPKSAASKPAAEPVNQCTRSTLRRSTRKQEREETRKNPSPEKPTEVRKQRSRSRRAPVEAKRRPRSPPPFSPSSYTSTNAEEDKRRAEEERVSNVERRIPRSETGTAEKCDSSQRKTEREDKRQQGQIRTDLPALWGRDPDHPEYKEEIKRQYFEDLERNKRTKVNLEEGPGGDRGRLLPEALLKAQGESEERQEKPKEKKKQKKRCPWVL